MRHRSRPDRHREYSLLHCGLVLLSVFATGLRAPVRAIESPGAPRTLRFTWDESNVRNAAADNSDSSLSQPALARSHKNAAGDSELYFTRTARGTRNLWHAPIKFAASPVINPSDADSLHPAEVGPRSRTSGPADKPLVAQALTQLAAPMFAENAVPLPNSRFLLCTTNAAGRPANMTRSAAGDALDVMQRSQIARLDLHTRRFNALTAANTRSYSPTLSPDGKRLAFVVERDGLESIYVVQLGTDGNFVGAPHRAVAVGRRPTWLNNSALVFQSTRPGQQALYQTALHQVSESKGTPAESATANHEPAKLLFSRGGTSAVSTDGRHLCVASDVNQSTINAGSSGSAQFVPSLYWLAADGSGARLISSTEGAANPCFAPDGSALLYDAPTYNSTDNSKGVASARRTLWFVPMLRVPPTAVLLDVRAAAKPLQSRSSVSPWQEIEIVGTIFATGDDAPQVKLEWGEGSQPTSWNSFTGVRSPVHASTLTVWRMPADARGDWTLRLSVTDASGDRTESTLPVTLPLPQATALDEAAPPVFARAIPVLPQVPVLTTQGPLTAPNVTVVPGAAPATVPSTVLPSPGASRAPSSTQTKPRTRRSREPRTPTIKPFDPSEGVRIPDQTEPRQAPRATQDLQIATEAGVAKALAALPPPAPERPALVPGRSSYSIPLVPEAPSSVSGASAARTGTETVKPTFPNSTAVVPQNGDGSSLRSSRGAVMPPDSEEADELLHSLGGPLPRVPPGVPPAPAQPSVPPPTTQQTAPRSSTPPSATRSVTPGRDTAGTSTQRATRPRPQRSVRLSGDSAVLSVSDLRSTAEAGSELSVSVNVRNVGTRGWSSGDTQPVRLLVRWQDVTTGRRSRWEIKWLRADVAPGGLTQLSADVTVPPRAGRYVLCFSLVRLNGPRYEPSGSDSNGDENEFGTVSYRVTVK